jgi:mRNA interferase MazF
MAKDYADWMPVKADINNKQLRPAGFKPREIWVANIGENVGHEEDGKGDRFTRPVLIVAAWGQLCFVLPLSTTDKQGKYYHAFDGHTGKTSVALLSQAQTMDSARLRRKTGYASATDFDEIKRRLQELLGL